MRHYFRIGIILLSFTLTPFSLAHSSEEDDPKSARPSRDCEDYGGLGGNNCAGSQKVPSFNDSYTPEITGTSCVQAGGSWTGSICLEPTPETGTPKPKGAGEQRAGAPPSGVTPTQAQRPPAAGKPGPAETLPNGDRRLADGTVVTEEQYQQMLAQQKQDLEAESAALKEAANKCLIARKDAQSCCRQPMSCLSGRENPEITSAVATLTGLIGTGVSMYMGQQNGGTDPGMQACKTLQYLGLGAGGLNGVLAGVCTTRKLSCDNTCADTYRKANELVLANCQTGQTSSNCTELKNARSTAQASISECGYLNANIQAMGGQSISALSGAGIASLCNQLSGSSVGFAALDKPPVFTGDCSNPANASNPACVNCSGANAATNPLCATPTPVGLGDGPSGSSLARANYGSNEAGANVNAAGLEGAGSQLPVTPAVAAEANKNSGVQGGGGGGLGAASPSANDGGGGQPGVAQGGGPNADIMQGTSGGNGFSGYASSPQTGGGEGGYGGYGQGGSERSAGPGFNLAQYLPGGQKAVAGRGLAAAAVGKSGELGKVVDDIWFRPTKYFNKWCRGDRLKCGVL